VQAAIFSMKSALEGRIQRAEEVAATLGHFKHEVAAAAEDAKTGRPLPRKLLEELESKGGCGLWVWRGGWADLK
jgi:hypothetical protein